MIDKTGVWKYHARLVQPGPISFRTSKEFLFEIHLQFCISLMVSIMNSHVVCKKQCGS